MYTAGGSGKAETALPPHDGTFAVAAHVARPGIPHAHRSWRAHGGTGCTGQRIIAGAGRALPLQLRHHHLLHYHLLLLVAVHCAASRGRPRH